MFALFHFGFELVKIAALSAIYSSLIYLLLSRLLKNRLPGHLSSIRFKSLFLWIAGLLLIFLFSYYGNHGLGDEANIPLGHFKTMESIDEHVFFRPAGSNNQMEIDSFLVKSDKLCMVSEDGICVYNLATNELKTFPGRSSYEQYALEKGLPTISQFQKFEPQYTEYWNTWRFWVLP
jgi:hypothetical protein